MKTALKALFKPSGRYSILALVVVGSVLTLMALFAGHQSFEATSSTEFCISCHEMESKPYQEYLESPHFKNASGVRAECADCHIPSALPQKIYAKTVSGFDHVKGKLLGTIDTPEKYEEKRLGMAQKVWSWLEETDSATCKGCHSYNAMDHTQQSKKAQKLMMPAAEKNQTCISCHKGIAHKLPDMSAGYRTKFEKIEKTAATPKSSKKVVTVERAVLYSSEGKKAGKVLPATELTVIGENGDRLQVEVIGWKRKPNAKVLNASMGNKIYQATLSRKFTKTAEVINTAKDENGREWQQVKFIGEIENKNLLTDIDPLWDYANEMYQGTCNQCHGAPEIGHFTANEWIAQLKGMMDFVDLNKREERTLLKFLQNESIKNDKH